MGTFFAKKHLSRVSEQDKAILHLKQTRDKIKQYQRKLEQNLENEKQLAKKLLQNGHKDRAILLLRKKKFQEHVLFKTDNQLENLERMVHDLEFAEVEMKVITGLKVGNTALKQLNDLLSIENIEKIMDETREGSEKQREISDILSGQLTSDDEVGVEAELNALLAVDTVNTLPRQTELPDVPQEEPESRTGRSKKTPLDGAALEA